MLSFKQIAQLCYFLGLLEKNRLLLCFVANFIADGFTRF